MSTLDVRIRNATVMLPSGPAHCTVGIAGGKLLLDPPDTLAAERAIDATGLTLMPGVIDAHLHFRDPGFPHKEDLFTGPLAAVTGGVTSFFEMPNTSPATISQARLAEKLAIASHKSLANYGFYLGATSDAAGAPGNLPDLATLRRSPGIKIFIGSSTGDLLVDDQAALERIFAETSAPICAHCEDEATILANREAIGAITSVADHSRIRDVRAAVRSTWRTLELTLRSRHRFHLLHVSTAAEAVLLARFFLTGTLVSREVAEALANTPASEHLRELEAIPFGGALAFARDPATALCRGLPPPLPALHRRLRTARHPRADEPAGEVGRRCPRDLGRFEGRRAADGGHRPRPAHAQREGGRLPCFALRYARRGPPARPLHRAGTRRGTALP
jgi:hypothetical protein